MEYEEDERSEFNTSEVDWGEEHDDLWEKGGDYESQFCYEQADSEISYGDELEVDEEEPEPPDYYQDDTSDKEETYQEGDLWCDETDSQFSQEEGDHEIQAEHEELNHEDQFIEPYHEEKPWCEEIDSQISLEETESDGEESGYKDDYAHESEDNIEAERWGEEEPGRGDKEPAPVDQTSHYYTPQFKSNQGNDCEQFDFQFITFSGHKQGPEAYLHWEKELEYWFRFYNIPKEERLTHAVNSLVGEASTWWINEEAMSCYYNPVITWGNLKQRMYKEFVQKFHNPNYTPKRLMFQTTTKAAKQSVQAKGVQQKTISTPPIDPKDKSLLGKSTQSNSVKIKEPTCYRCHKRGHYAATCPERQVIKPTSLEPEPNLPKSSDNLVKTDSKFSNSSIMHLSLPKVVHAGIDHTMENKTKERSPEAETRALDTGQIPTLKQQVKKKQEIVSSLENAKVIFQVSPLVFNESKTVLMHLLLVKTVETYAGRTKETQKTPEPPDSPYHIQGELKGETKSEKGDFTRNAALLPKENTNKPWRGVIATLLIKEEPPDAHIPSYMYRQKDFGQGKFLDPYSCKDSNLLYLGAGYTVSRSKPFQEGEYDEDIKSSSTKEHGTRSHEEESMKLRRAKETSELSSAQMEAKFKHQSSTNTWRTYSTHPELSTKKNQPKRIPIGEDIEDTFWKVFNGRYGDLRSLIESFRSNQDDLSYKSNCSRFSTHRRNTANWTRFNQTSDQGVISFTNRVNRNFPDLDPGALIGVFRPNQTELGHEPTFGRILTQPGITSNWIHSNPGFGLGDIYFLSGRILNLPYLEAHGFRSLQTHIWRPGEYLLQPEASSLTSRHLGESSISFPCTSIHRIRRIPLFSNLPYPEAFTLGAITHQRLVPFCCCVLETHSLNLDVPRHHSFTPKLSRLKHHHNLPSLADIVIKPPTATFSFNIAI